MSKLILDLCASTGAWSQPYLDAGYEVKRINLPMDIRLMPIIHSSVHGVLAAPPCTYFCRMRMCRGKPTDDQFREGLSVVDACLRVITITHPNWWVLENPSGYLTRWLGEPSLKFHPWEYGDPWTKRTWLWGKFRHPVRNPVKSEGPWVNARTSHPLGKKGKATNARERSKTPPGFAKAFFEANP